MDPNIKGNYGLENCIFQSEWCSFAEFQGLEKQSRVISSIHKRASCTMYILWREVPMFQTHKLAKHTPDHLRPYRCSFCPKGFAFKKHLEVHENVHTGNKPYECKYCGMKFASDGNMNGHIRQTHKGIKRNTSKYVGAKSWETKNYWYFHKAFD